MGNVAPRTAVTNVRVFDGRRLQPPDTVVIEAGRICSGSGGDLVIDGEGGVLLPGSSTPTSTCATGARSSSWPRSA